MSNPLPYLQCHSGRGLWYGGGFTAELLELIGSRKVEILVGSGALLHIDEAHIVAQRKRIVLIDLHAGAQTCASINCRFSKI